MVHPRRNRQRGFSLTELVVVTVLLGILGALAVGAVFPDLARARRAGAARRIAMDLQFARDTAMQRRLHTWIVFATGTESYTMYVENRSSLGRANRVALSRPDQPGTNTVTLTEFFPGVDLSSATFNGGAEVGFNNYGAPHDAAGTALSTDGSVGIASGPTVTVAKGSGAVRRNDE